MIHLKSVRLGVNVGQKSEHISAHQIYVQQSLRSLSISMPEHNFSDDDLLIIDQNTVQKRTQEILKDEIHGEYHKRSWITNGSLYHSKNTSSGNFLLTSNINGCHALESSILAAEDPIIVLDDIGAYRDRCFSSIVKRHGFRLIDEPKSPISKTKKFPQESSWDNIGGYSELIKNIKDNILCLLDSDSYYGDLGIDPPKGILLYGPPGCSKTMIARAVASSAGLGFISIKGPEIFSKWVGDSEKAISEVFGKARSLSPCVVFFDEFDSVGSVRSSENSGVESRVISQILCEMDGISSRSRILVIAATNRPDVLDPALLRPGRFDLHFNVPLPDFASRKEIISLKLSKSNAAHDMKLIEELAEKSEGKSGAEITQACKQLILLTIKNPESKVDIETLLSKRD